MLADLLEKTKTYLNRLSNFRSSTLIFKNGSSQEEKPTHGSSSYIDLSAWKLSQSRSSSSSFSFNFFGANSEQDVGWFDDSNQREIGSQNEGEQVMEMENFWYGFRKEDEHGDDSNSCKRKSKQRNLTMFLALVMGLVRAKSGSSYIHYHFC